MGKRFPILRTIARDLLAVPATTVASEAAFSTGGRVITESRNCLKPGIVEAIVVGGESINYLSDRGMSAITTRLIMLFKTIF